ncbi:MAG: hypothetical protein K5858_09930 [Lachnospiraceae bacterium]|nr:hypothetical protein [Lachnospiraceae bacterium]
MKNRLFKILPALCFAVAILTGSIGTLAFQGPDYSEFERRKLAAFPKFSAESIADGSFIKELDTYLADHFAGREELRKLVAFYQLGLLNENEYNGFVRKGESIISLQKQINEASLEYAKSRFLYVYERYLKNTGCSFYDALIPDKSAFLEEEGYPVLDFEKMEEMYGDGLSFGKDIPLKESLALSDYYLTDSHLRQEKITEAAKAILSALGRDTKLLEKEFIQNPVYPFYGVYAGQSAMSPEPETLYYLTGGYLDSLRAFDPMTKEEFPVYDPDGCDKRDMYTLFTGGGKGLIRIDNPEGKKGELIVFRDSFGAAFAPLLAAGYSRVTLVDLRYIHPDVLSRYIRFNDQDVLFLYSETFINNSQGLR